MRVARMKFFHVPKSASLAERIAIGSVADVETGCRLWARATSSRKGAHGQMFWKGRMHAVHRLAYIAAFGRIPRGKWVWHSCHNSLCVEPSHLRLGNHKDIVADHVATKRKRGERCSRAKLTQAQALAIRADPRSQRVIAADYGVSRPLVSAIKIRRIWNHF